jgi:hypothetical protein
MHYRVIGSVVVIIAFMGLVGVGRDGFGTSAQEETDALAGHPLVGTWLAMAPGGASPETFAADGSFIASPPILEAGSEGVIFLSPLLGVWESTGERSGHFTAVQALSDATGAYTGSLTIDGYLDVSADGQSFIDDGPETTLTFRDAANTVVAVIKRYEAGDGSVPPVTAVRMAVDAPGFPAGTTAAATPPA